MNDHRPGQFHPRAAEPGKGPVPGGRDPANQPEGCRGVRVRNATGTPGVQNSTVIVPSRAVSDTVTVSPDFTADIIARRTTAAD